MNTAISRRILYTIACFCIAILFPYWAVFVAVLLGMYFFDWYVEGLVVVLLGDILFGAPLAHFHHSVFVSTLCVIVVFVGIEIAKKFTRYGHS
jgi:hypothetical protein